MRHFHEIKFVEYHVDHLKCVGYLVLMHKVRNLNFFSINLFKWFVCVWMCVYSVFTMHTRFCNTFSRTVQSTIYFFFVFFLFNDRYEGKHSYAKYFTQYTSIRIHSTMRGLRNTLSYTVNMLKLIRRWNIYAWISMNPQAHYYYYFVWNFVP